MVRRPVVPLLGLMLLVSGVLCCLLHSQHHLDSCEETHPLVDPQNRCILSSMIRSMRQCKESTFALIPERISRVRSMVEAIEKYRQRQMEALGDTYHRKINALRDNYHSQVEQIRATTQHQKENVTQHIDAIKENYNQQVNRIRDYGSRRAEQLW